MADLRDNWKNTGRGLGHAFRDLGKSLVKTAATAVDKVDNWANAEDAPEAPAQPTEETKENE